VQTLLSTETNLNCRSVSYPQAERLVSTNSPRSKTGQVIVAIEIGALRASLKASSGSLPRALTTLNILAALAGVSGVTAKDLIHVDRTRADGTACQVQVVGDFANLWPN
jgi:hypothetical protein